jgi:tetratricopeptide (TPR) repeat protein
MRLPKMSKWAWIGTVVCLLSISILLILTLPGLRDRLSWRTEMAFTYLRGWVDPVEPLPTNLPKPRVYVTRQPTETPLPTSTPEVPLPTATPAPTPTPLPSKVSLPAPSWERQDINNCGPASLTMYLRYWGWEGNQKDIAEVIKPDRKDRNVNVEELVYYVRNKAGWLNIEYRVGADFALLKQILSSGMPVMIEEGMFLEETFWPNDDHWAAHYLLLTGYDDSTQTFTSQDSFYGPDREVSYQELDQNWLAFNRVIILIYPPDRQTGIENILGDNWDVDFNRQRALDTAQAETIRDPQNAFAWFNLGTNLVYFERYFEGANAYDQAISIGLPQRMFRYQFGPFMAYFHSNRLDDLFEITDYALKRTPNAEEAFLWQGWGYFRQGKNSQALENFYSAIEQNPNYQDAKYALDYIRSNP